MTNQKAIDYANQFIDPTNPNEKLFDQKYKEYMENQKDKEAFFAQYFGQKVHQINTDNTYFIDGKCHGVGRLLLKSLENISDEDA